MWISISDIVDIVIFREMLKTFPELRGAMEREGKLFFPRYAGDIGILKAYRNGGIFQHIDDFCRHHQNCSVEFGHSLKEIHMRRGSKDLLEFPEKIR
ncbi:hypothetical protein CDAR_22971 [Caerostris darwini]|uniref:Uncharacterized protein n=1 Tax=Caerostris darwini TaxID=1538125 RepID=A0AAV4WIX4_9ARAC|nr:hypothetical protein CDAR_22971 [Caerostris darwini]